MEISRIFEVVNSVALLGWALMIFTPGWKYTQKMVRVFLLPTLFAIVYGVLIFSSLDLSNLDFSSLAEIRTMFSSDVLLLAGWIHYLAFDLVVGSWILIKSQNAGLTHWLVIPALFLTFILGPIGLFFFLFSYLAKKKSWPQMSS